MADVLAAFVKSSPLELNSLSTADHRRQQSRLHLLARRLVLPPSSLLLLEQSMSMPDQQQRQPRPSPPLPTRRCLFGRSDPIQDAVDRLRIREQLNCGNVARWNYDFERDQPRPGRYEWLLPTGSSPPCRDSTATPVATTTLQLPTFDRSNADTVAVPAVVLDNIADAHRSGTGVDVLASVERRTFAAGLNSGDVTARAADRLHDQSTPPTTCPVSNDATPPAAEQVRHLTSPGEVNHVSRHSTTIKKKRRRSGHLTTIHSAGAARLTAFYPIKKSAQMKRCSQP